MRFDFVIVGGGTAGSVLAGRLSEDPGLKVCLLEAGPAEGDAQVADPLAWPSLQGSAFDWGYKSEPQPKMAGRRMDWPRGRLLGGSSGINAMAHVRGHPSDFDAWEAAGCPGWGFSDLLPYFRKSEDSPFPASPYRGKGGPVKLARIEEPHPLAEAYMEAAQGLGMPAIGDHNGGPLQGAALNTLTLVEGKRQTAAQAYLGSEVQARGSLTILTDCFVEGLLFEGTRCLGVTAESKGESLRLEAERGVILSAGAIASPTFLLRAGIGDPEELKRIGIACQLEVPGVGRNLQDHLLSGSNLYKARKPVPVSKYQHSESLLYSHAPDEKSAPRVVLACVAAPVVTEQFEAPPFGEAYSIMFGFTHPKSRGRLWLESADPKAAPKLDPGYFKHPEDMGTYLEALDWAREVGAQPAFSEWREAELLPEAEDLSSEAGRRSFLERAAYTHHHPVGTCKMGSDAQAVVGPDLALRGAEGLYVVDASVIPSITTGPVNAAIIAIAERASDLLKGLEPLAPEHPERAAG